MYPTWQISFQGVLRVLEMHQEMLALVLCTVERGRFEVHYHHLGGWHILATVAHISNILGSHWCLPAILVLCSIENSWRTVEYLGIIDEKEDNHSQVAKEIDRCVSQKNGSCYQHFVNSYLLIPDCHQGIMVSQIRNPTEPGLRSQVEIC